MLPLHRPVFAHQKTSPGRRLFLSGINIMQRRPETCGLGGVCLTISKWKLVIFGIRNSLFPLRVDSLEQPLPEAFVHEANS